MLVGEKTAVEFTSESLEAEICGHLLAKAIATNKHSQEEDIQSCAVKKKGERVGASGGP